MPTKEYPVNQVISTGKRLQNFVAGIYNPKSKDLVWVVANAFPEYDEDRNLKQVVVTFWDYTQLKLAESALARRTHDLTRANLAMHKEIAERKLVEKKLKEKQRQSARDLEVAAGIQQSLIPAHSPKVGSIQVAWSFKPCERIGGDIFNFLRTGGTYISFYMLDVCGHGVSSALISAAVSQFLQTNCELLCEHDQNFWPKETLNRLERVFPFERFDSFFTIACLTIDYTDGNLTYGCAGHPPPILLHPQGALEILDVHGPVIGSGQNEGYRQVEKQLQPGDKIVLYTDGILDLPNSTGTFFGKQRFYNALEKHGDQHPQAIVDSLTRITNKFAGNAKIRDDISLMVIEYG
jgi:sigma-B regulation protein RsbU (phosphoserine phosphatase)